MKRSVPIETLKKVLSRNEIETRKSFEIIEDIMKVLQDEEESKEPPVKKQYVIMLSAPDGGVLEEGEAAGWVLQIPDDASAHTARARLIEAARHFNASPKGRKFPVETVGDACESIPTEISKEFQLWIRTKTPVLVILTDNSLPKPKETN